MIKKGTRVLVKAIVIEHVCADAYILEVPSESEEDNKFVASAVTDFKSVETPVYVGCNMDLCPRGHERLCCFECEELEECHTTHKKACDELEELRNQGKTQFECEFYRTSTQSPIYTVNTKEEKANI